jgi:hypothetical protein
LEDYAEVILTHFLISLKVLIIVPDVEIPKLKCSSESGIQKTIDFREIKHIRGIIFSVKVKVKESRNRPGVAQKVPGGLGSQIS